MVTMQSWMFLSSYEKIRKRIIEEKSITTLLHMDNMVMGIAFGTAATVIRNKYVEGFKGQYTEVKYENINENNTPEQFPVKENRFGNVSSEDFSKIPGSPIAYWASEKVMDIFSENKNVADVADVKVGLQTGDNDTYLRLWHEVSVEGIGFNRINLENALISKKKWFPYNKGGLFRKWYGNQEYVVNWEKDGAEIKNFVDGNGKQRSRPKILRSISKKA